MFPCPCSTSNLHSWCWIPYLMRFQNHISHFHWFHTNLLESRNTLLISPRSHIKIIGKGEKKIRFFPCVQVNMYYCRVDGALKCNLSIPIILCWGWVLAPMAKSEQYMQYNEQSFYVTNFNRMKRRQWMVVVLDVYLCCVNNRYLNIWYRTMFYGVWQPGPESRCQFVTIEIPDLDTVPAHQYSTERLLFHWHWQYAK